MKKYLLLLGASALLLSACNNTTPVSVSSPEAFPADETILEDDATTSMMAEPTAYTLAEQNDSGQTGTMTLSETADGQTTVALALTGGTFTQPQPAHIHVGSCPEPGSVQYPLTSVVNGESVTTLDMTIAQILASSPELAVNIHKSAAESSVYTACGNIQ